LQTNKTENSTNFAVLGEDVFCRRARNAEDDGLMSVYLDCNATTPTEPRVSAAVLRFLTEEFGNAGSRTHDFGLRAKQAVERAREQVARVVAAKRDEVIFTSGATESNNLAILGLREYGERSARPHIVSTAIEHKAVLEPLEYLEKKGFQVTLVRPERGGWVEPAKIADALRKDTLLVSVMQVNNETGVAQPISKICDLLADHPAFFHVDAAQGFGKEIDTLRNHRIDLASISGHKIYGPKGVGALVVRRRGFDRAPLTPLAYGGGQERGLRPGTLPVPQIVGLGLAAEIAVEDHSERAARCRAFRDSLISALQPLRPVINGDQSRTLPHVINLLFPGLDSEAVMLALKHVIAISNGSACTSQKYSPSHVLTAMGLGDDIVKGALRISWCHMTEQVNWEEVAAAVRKLQ
jgi:cysteine desulfurase